MTLNSTVEHPPLLKPGFYIFSLPDMRRLCVDPFPNSATRDRVMLGIEYIVGEVQNASIPCEIWIDGSFLTEKENPNDADILLKIDAYVIENGTEEQKRILNWIRSNLRNDHHCDSFILPIYGENDPLAVHNIYFTSYWVRQFGFSRGEHLKGIAVIRTGENS